MENRAYLCCFRIVKYRITLLMLQKQVFISSPFYTQKLDKPLKRILVNAVGFGGNAVSILIEKPVSKILTGLKL